MITAVLSRTNVIDMEPDQTPLSLRQTAILAAISSLRSDELAD